MRNYLIFVLKYKNKDYEIFIDDNDYQLYRRHYWYLRDAGKKKLQLSVCAKGGKRLHRVLLGIKDSKIQIDHKNGNRLDNRRKNLRICTNQQNNCNKGKTSSNTSGYKGVTWNLVYKKWQAQIKCNYKNNYLGLYSNKINAAKAYDKAAKKFHGEFAKLNFKGN